MHHEAGTTQHVQPGAHHLQNNTEQRATGKTSGSDSCLSFAGDLHCLRSSAAAYITELEPHVCVRYVDLQAARWI